MVQGLGFRVYISGVRVQVSGLGLGLGSVFGIQNPGVRYHRLVFRVQGLGFIFEGLGFGV